MNIGELFSFIDSVKFTITKGMPPDKNCADWNQDLGIALRAKSVEAAAFGSREYKFKSSDGGEITGHIIVVALLDQKMWVGVDLSSGQVEGLSDTMVWTGDSLASLGRSIDRDMPGFGTLIGKAGESSFHRQAESSLQKDFREHRYLPFEQSVSRR